MGDYIFLLGGAGIVWMAFSLYYLLREFKAFREDYRRVHKLEASQESSGTVKR